MIYFYILPIYCFVFYFPSQVDGHSNLAQFKLISTCYHLHDLVGIKPCKINFL